MACQCICVCMCVCVCVCVYTCVCVCVCVCVHVVFVCAGVQRRRGCRSVTLVCARVPAGAPWCASSCSGIAASARATTSGCRRTARRSTTCAPSSSTSRSSRSAQSSPTSRHPTPTAAATRRFGTHTHTHTHTHTRTRSCAQNPTESACRLTFPGLWGRLQPTCMNTNSSLSCALTCMHNSRRN